MPKFVPVKDSERPTSEQSPDEEGFSQHRKFDAPHAIKRGWGVGEVGWGVNKTFGDEKDMSAQVVKHAEGANKMVRNEKGLWVKAKTLDLREEDDRAFAAQGRGRGKAGVSVIDHLLGQPLTNRSDEDHGREQRRRADSESEDSSERRGRRSRSTRDSRERRRDNKSRSPSRSRSRDRRKHRQIRSRSRERHSDRDRRKPRSRSRSRDRQSSRRNRSRSVSRSKSRGDSRRRNSDSRDYRRRSRSRSHSPSRTDNKQASQRSREKPSTSASSNSRGAASPDHAAKDEDIQVEITAVQVANRFHEVYSYQSSSRLGDISDLFQEGASIHSMKNEAVLLTGKTAIRGSFEKTKASHVQVSKRVFMKHPDCPVTYVLDFHRPGTSPGLGNMQKCTVLLYECLQAKITAIYGMVDVEQLADSSDLVASKCFESKAWSTAAALIDKRKPETWNKLEVSEHCFFHNYDHMEVWG